MIIIVDRRLVHAVAERGMKKEKKRSQMRSEELETSIRGTGE